LLTPKDGEPAKVPFPISSVAGAVAGFSSTLCVYPLELLKTRLTIQVRGSSWISFHSRFSRINQMQLLSNKCMFFCIYKFALSDTESLCFALQIALTYGLYVCVFCIINCCRNIMCMCLCFCKVAVGYGAAAIKKLFT
jgi:hypothetical protein